MSKRYRVPAAVVCEYIGDDETTECGRPADGSYNVRHVVLHLGWERFHYCREHADQLAQDLLRSGFVMAV